MWTFIKRVFAWWDGATLGALYDIRRRGRYVGEDDFGNRYFEERKPEDGERPRRYVIYRGYAEPSKVPADWHGWLHHVFDAPPTEAPLKAQIWERPHLPNLTGTLYAYRPEGSLAKSGQRAAASGDYEAWRPE
ncbi:MAG: NADH:ubiquinone oxidoreductase subunit NDUFA12 [Maricaulaceae bacterium]